MKLIIKIALAIFAIPIVYAQAPVRVVPPPITRADINKIISRNAFIYSVPEARLHKIIACESSYNPDAVNENKWEYSVGLSQINLKVHDISEEDARDPHFAVDYLARELAAGRGRAWTCAR